MEEKERVSLSSTQVRKRPLSFPPSLPQGADVNALPVPSSKDTALTIAADKGHAKFVDMILRYGANVDVKNKKGNSPLWLACNGTYACQESCALFGGLFM